MAGRQRESGKIRPASGAIETSGLKSGPAICALPGLKGDPRAAVPALEARPERELRELVTAGVDGAGQCRCDPRRREEG